jgi:hypothetical protein
MKRVKLPAPAFREYSSCGDCWCATFTRCWWGGRGMSRRAPPRERGSTIIRDADADDLDRLAARMHGL